MIRLSRPDDRDAIVALILGIQNGEFNLNLTLTEQADLLDIAAHYFADGGGFWVATTQGGEIVGSIGLMKKSGRCAVLKKFFLKPEFRGKASGYAAALFNAVVAFAKGQGIAQIILDTPSVAVRSHRFYRSVGFQLIDPAQLPISYAYPDRDSLLFCLDLRPPFGAAPP